MKSNSTLLDYTKSAEEIRKFKLKEECHKIAAEYEKFNIENGVYEKFGEWLLEKAKDRYTVDVDSFELMHMLTKSESECPEQKKINCMREDYFWCKELREICPDEWCSRMCYRSSYTWYTLWKIAKAYNGKYGCVVRVSPRERYNYFWFALDWSQDANDCISKEKWRSRIENSFMSKVGFGLWGCMIWFVVWALIAAIASLPNDNFIGMNSLFVTIVPAFLFFCFPVRNFLVSNRIKSLSEPFKDHCERISQTKDSEFDVEKGDVTNEHYSRWK